MIVVKISLEEKMSNPDTYLFNASQGQFLDFTKKLVDKKTILGIDPGEKRMGLAISDTLLMIATPLLILERKSFDKDIAKIETIINERDVGAIVCGYPLQMNGLEGESAQKAVNLASKIITKTKLPTLMWDERLSTSAMQRFLIEEADLSRKKRSKVIDSSAAAFILQGVLDAIKHQKNS
ncbi:MAG: Holliday junction resolvase RuvX [Alphaproteobacteria bacterium]